MIFHLSSAILTAWKVLLKNAYRSPKSLVSIFEVRNPKAAKGGNVLLQSGREGVGWIGRLGLSKCTLPCLRQTASGNYSEAQEAQLGILMT